MLLYKFKSTEPLAHVLDILLEQRLYCATYTELNDPFEGQFVREFRDSPEARAILYALTSVPSLSASTRKIVRIPKTVDDLPTNTDARRVCSLTSGLDDVRMWSLYASGHRGLAFELDLEGLVPSVQEVRYYPDLKSWRGDILGDLAASQVLTRKTKHWEYEREFRLITSEPYVPVAGRIRRVILGARATPMLDGLVRRLVDPSISVVKAVLDVDGVRVSV